jgi:hypothetical protein
MQVYDILELVGGPGLLWYTREVFSDFLRKLELQYADRTDNSGVFIRVPDLDSSNANDWAPSITQSYEIQTDPRGFNSEKNIENDPLRSTGAIYNPGRPRLTCWLANAHTCTHNITYRVVDKKNRHLTRRQTDG